jgi:outer membrane receptor for ferrienterochelin and colicin
VKKTTKLLLIVLILTGFTDVYAQSGKVSVSGTVLDAKTQEPLEMVVVSIKELNLWTTTDKKGKFTFKKFPAGSYTIYSSCLGYEDYLRPAELKKNIDNFKLMLKKRSLALKEVTVTAKENKGNGTSSKIEKSALDHIQPMSLTDVMQLVPGQVSLNPDLGKVNQISIRGISTVQNGAVIGVDKMEALGTAIVVNGSPISNDANLQLVSTATTGKEPEFAASAGGGIDLRQISTDNIESVEVIRGIASVEYGEMTSGAVIVNTKAGKSPLRAKMKIDAKTKQFYAGKGYLLGDNKGALNFDIDYAHSYNDIRTTSKGYNRLTGQLSYSNVFFKGNCPLSFNSKLSLHSTKDEDKQDKDMVREEKERTKDQGVSLNINGSWSLNKPWITNIKYSFSASYSHQESYIKKLQSSASCHISTSLTSGEFTSVHLPNEYYSELNVDGKPINLFGKISANLAGKYGKIYNKFLLGCEWRTNGNDGDGRTFDMSKPYSPKSVNAIRPRSYKDIPFLNQYSVFIEDKVKLPIATTNLDIQAGMRINNLRPKGLFDTRFKFTYEPRLNLKYQILNRKNNSLFEDLSIRGGYGINIKNPTLIYLFPDKAYFDMVGFNTSELGVITTKVIEDTSNPDLKPAKNTKKELGLDFNIKKVSVSITGFKENLKDGFSFNDEYDIMHYSYYGLPKKGKNYTYQDGELFANEVPVTATMDTVFNKYSTPKNNYSLKKEGIEYYVNFGKCKVLRTSLIVDGAYLKTVKRKVGNSFYLPSETWNRARYPFVGIYAGGKSEIRKRFNTNFRFVTHVPEVKLVLSVTAQVIWLEKSQKNYENSNGDVVPYIVDAQGNRITGSEVYSNTDYKKYVDPIKYMDKMGKIHSFTQSDESIPVFNSLIRLNQQKLYIEESYPTTLQVNMRLSKEIRDNISFSFFANNVFNNRPLVKLDISDS